MAECQHPFSYDEQVKYNLKTSLSTKRFHAYLLKAGFDENHAIQLYLYNARLSKSFLFPIHILEITLRNRIHQILAEDFTQNWHQNPDFLNILTTQSRSSIDTAIARTRHKSKPEIDDIIASLTFDFWSNLFRPEYDRLLWQSRMKRLLPQRPFSRRDFQQLLASINYLRNRIAHHEPIHYLNLSLEHSNIMEALTACCQTTANWTKSHSTVHQVLRTKPNKGGFAGPLLQDRCDNNFKVHIGNTSCKVVTELTQRFIICVDNENHINAVVEMDHIGRHLLSLVDKDHMLLCDLNDETLDSVVKRQSLNNNFIELDGFDNLQCLADSFKSKGIKYAIIRDGKQHTFLGVIAKAHRRY